MRSKNDILNDYDASNGLERDTKRLELEVLCDQRDQCDELRTQLSYLNATVTTLTHNASSIERVLSNLNGNLSTVGGNTDGISDALNALMGAVVGLKPSPQSKRVPRKPVFARFGLAVLRLYRYLKSIRINITSTNNT